ncbi:LpxL/LpxP family acyltransferase [Paraglaciecola hydrolytica]|uniref:Family 2 glycosyl transferase n=1 Tax=Paraglaciecola hydrolytica TaxID=1799789 RepID=A0A136A268_9ALTE|nr:family 2 glycosyl transferase [Paraglaciecola hydrolytica]KXI29325.1 family 2 glycosyl transferase [Paraglaciecola hydrolytica]
MSRQQHWSSIKERGSLLGIRTLVLIYKVFGKGLFKVCFWPVMLYFYLTGGQARSGILTYWRQVEISRHSPPCNRFMLHVNGFKVFLTFGMAIVDKFDAWLGKINIADIDIVDEQCYQSLTGSGGCVILSTHLGNMEICRAIFSSGANKKKLNVITYNEHAPSFNNFLKRINPDAAINFIHINNFGPDDTIQLKQKIEDGEAVVIFADRTSVNNPDSVDFVPFLSKPAPIAIGPFALATIMSCPVYFMTCLKNSESGKYQVHIEEFAQPTKVKRNERKAYFNQLMTKYADRLSHYCLLEPYQWANFFDFWQGNASTAAEQSENKKTQ